jgi:hypothetical protein
MNSSSQSAFSEPMIVGMPYVSPYWGHQLVALRRFFNDLLLGVYKILKNGKRGWHTDS